MLTLRRDQIETLAKVPQELFLREISWHLQEVYPLTFPGCQRDFSSATAYADLRDEMGFLCKRGFSSAYDIAAALELFNIFGIDMRSEPVRQTLDDDTLTATEKLNRLYEIAGFQENP